MRMVAFALFLAVLLDPIAIILAIVTGINSRSWWHVAIAAIAIATIGEMILSATQITWTFDPIVFGMRVIADAIWTGLVFIAKGRGAAGLIRIRTLPIIGSS
jgi:hypothetical protein